MEGLFDVGGVRSGFRRHYRMDCEGFRALVLQRPDAGNPDHRGRLIAIFTVDDFTACCAVADGAAASMEKRKNNMKNKMILRNMMFALLLIFTVQLSVTVGQTKTKHLIKQKVQTAKVTITEQGYTPASVKLRRGVPTRITFLRTTNATCATDVVISAYGINRSLPLNKAVVVSFTPKKSGEFTFTCGMNMMRGKLIVQ